MPQDSTVLKTQQNAPSDSVQFSAAQGIRTGEDSIVKSSAVNDTMVKMDTISVPVDAATVVSNNRNKPIKSKINPEKSQIANRDQQYIKLQQDFPPQNFLSVIPSHPARDVIPVFVQNHTGISTHTVASSLKEIPRKQNNQSFFKGSDWIIGVFILISILLAWVRVYFGKYLHKVTNSTHNYQASYSLYRDKNVLLQRVNISLNWVFFLSTGVFLYQLVQLNQITIPWLQSIQVFLFFLTGIGVFYLFRNMMVNITAYLFQQKELLGEYLYNVNLFYKNIGLFLIPVIVGIAYVNARYSMLLLYSGLAIVSVLFILRYLRGFQIILKNRVSVFYLILYFCTLEFLPVLVLYKFIQPYVT
ncbi:MAG: DUF4271 domain-containing protein [Bacteroidota bacterium]